MPIVFFLFIAVPIVEIWVLIEVGSSIGGLNTVLLVILTAFIGATMLRIQGLSIITRVREQAAANQLPALEIFEGLFLLVGGVLLLTPGFVTDILGFMCLLPVTRGMMMWAASKRLSGVFTGKRSRDNRYTSEGRFDSTDSNIIDGEYRHEK